MLSILYAHFISFCVYLFRLLVSLLYNIFPTIFIFAESDLFHLWTVWLFCMTMGSCVCVFVSTCAFETIIQYIVTVKYWIVTILAQFDHYSCPILFATVNCLYFKTELIYYLIWVLFNFFPFIHWISFFFCSIVYLQTKMFQKLL